jgi:deoxyribodipyrimidine photolyase
VSSTGLVWFRRDLRLDDNPAFAAAIRGHRHGDGDEPATRVTTVVASTAVS